MIEVSPRLDPLEVIMDNLTIYVTPAMLREIADDLEQNDTNFCRTLVAEDGTTLVDIMLPQDDD